MRTETTRLSPAETAKFLPECKAVHCEMASQDDYLTVSAAIGAQ